MDVVEAASPTVRSFAWPAKGMAKTDAASVAAIVRNFMMELLRGSEIRTLPADGKLN
jgi:hypothetical protein